MTDLSFGPFTVSPLTRQLRRGAEVIPLPANAFDLLLRMAQSPGVPLPKKDLLRSVWADTHVDESNLTQSISILRRALGPEGEGTIVTLPGIGYQFASRVREVAAEAQPLTIQTTESYLTVEEVMEERVRWWTSPLPLRLAGIGLILLGVTGWLAWERYEDRVGGPPVQIVIAAAEGTTGDAVLDRTLASLLRIQLAQSPFVTLIPASTIRARLTQMEHKPDDLLTVALAREVCERTGGQAVIHSSMARAGGDYLLTEEAVNCADGTTIGASTRTVNRPEQLPRALAAMAADVRHSLGESRRTIARFRSPLYPVTTSSLDALKDFSESQRLFSLGKFGEAADPLKQAVALDPNFASAWANLGTIALNALDRTSGVAYMQKAYDTRQFATEPERLYIVARYVSEVTGDLYEGIRNYRSWTDTYPRSAQAWAGMAVALHDLGRNADLLAAAKKTLELAPAYSTAYTALGDAQIRKRDFAGARATFASALAHGLDGDYLRVEMLRVGYLQHDADYVAEQETWGRAHPDSFFLLANEAAFALQHGRVAEGVKLAQQTLTVMEHGSQKEYEAAVASDFATSLAGIGETGQAYRLMATITFPSTTYDYLAARIDTNQADTNQSAPVAPLLAAKLKDQPHATLWNEWWGPILKGRLLLDAHKPQEALVALEPTRQFDGRSFDALYQRGLAYEQLGQTAPAEASFRTILAHPEFDPSDIHYPLAQIELARVLTHQGRKQEAAEAYRAFLAEWEQADAGQPMLLQVQIELQAL